MRKKNHNMAKLVTASALAVGLAAVAQSASAAISTSRHNMGNTAATSANRTTMPVQQICVFCHTPHGSNTSVTAPLWNKYTTKTAASYTNYTSANSATMDAVNTGPGSVSIACLTCHDGTQAMDNMLNGPGVGVISTDGGGISGLQSGYTWSSGGTSTGVTSDGILLGPTGTRNANIGTDLSNDHPVGINYCASVANVITTINTTNCNDTDFNAGTTVSGRSWIDNGTAGTYQKTDFPLYTSGGSTVKVECATCHDPHENQFGVFLRKDNTNSGVCLACHVK